MKTDSQTRLRNAYFLISKGGNQYTEEDSLMSNNARKTVSQRKGEKKAMTFPASGTIFSAPYTFRCNHLES